LLAGFQADVAVLEEPEHLNWYHHGRRWTDKFNHVVGIMHTNYLDYAQREENGNVKAAALSVINHVVCRLHCHKVRLLRPV
jgi:digalactosyldiacylglycerol synthase